MRPLDPLDVEGDGVEAFRHGGHFGGGHEQKARGGVDEAADCPRAGDAVDLGAVAGDPEVGRGQRRDGNHRQVGRRPTDRTALQHLGRDALQAQQRRRTLGQLAPLGADDNHPLTQQPDGRRVALVMRQRKTAGHQAGIVGKILGQAHVDQRGTFRRADQAHQLGRGDLVGLWHGWPPVGKATLGPKPHGAFAWPQSEQYLCRVAGVKRRLWSVRAAIWRGWPGDNPASRAR